jgi:hypothetical protein
MEAELAVSAIIRAELESLAGIADEQGENHNAFLQAISPTLSLSSKLTRSLTSKLGRRLAAMARDLAELRYGAASVPPAVVSATVTEDLGAAAVRAGDTVIYSQLDVEAVASATSELFRFAGSGLDRRIGTDAFRAEFRGRLARLLELPRAATPWFVQVDLYVRDPMVGLAELESGGELDTSNVMGQSQKLIRAGLALADPDTPLHFCLAYPNRGERAPIRSSLSKYFTATATVTPSAGLLVGRAWWERVLPWGITHERFLALFAEMAQELEIVPAEIRP